VSTAPLFPAEAKRRFTAITGDRYRNMSVRLEKKGLCIPFTLAKMRDHILDAMGDRYDGALKCRYCGKVCDISEVALDHAVPLARGGSPDLSNIELPCAKCNAAKGECTAGEFQELVAFLENCIPLARTDIIDRLAKYGKLVSAKRKSDMLLRNNGQFPKKARALKPPITKMLDEGF
jgi:5-methylcytosine-specific restriction endonuclease McrA